MQIRSRKKFKKQYKKLLRRQQNAVDDALHRSRKNPHDSTLFNHPLKGSLKGRGTIAAGFDLRIIFREEEGYTIVIMLQIGTHEEVYRKA